MSVDNFIERAVLNGQCHLHLPVVRNFIVRQLAVDKSCHADHSQGKRNLYYTARFRKRAGCVLPIVSG